MRHLLSRFFPLPLTAALLAAVLGGCGRPEQPGTPPIPVTVAKAEQREAFHYVDTIGNVTALEAVNIIPQASGRILEIDFTQGADVKKGEPLTRANVRSVRPGNGLPPADLDKVLAGKAARDLTRGEPLDWSMVG